GTLSYATSEGLLLSAAASRPLVQTAKALSAEHKVQPVRLRGIPTGAHVPLHRGFHTMTLIGLDETGLPPHWNQPTDRLGEVDEAAIEQTVDFAESLLRRLQDQ